MTDLLLMKVIVSDSPTLYCSRCTKTHRLETILCNIILMSEDFVSQTDNALLLAFQMQWPLAPDCMLFSHLLQTGLCTGKATEGGMGWQLSPKKVLPCHCSDTKWSMQKQQPLFNTPFCLFINL